ncbi:glycosyltransferase family 1 protein, partial [Clostridium saudiense]|nr:glycosyltransferase family 1 protein [Clostridium saudiense]
MKIGIITAGVLPVPPIKGGAVENLVYSIINENEKADNPIKIDLYGIGIDEVNFPMTTHKNT